MEVKKKKTHTKKEVIVQSIQQYKTETNFPPLVFWAVFEEKSLEKTVSLIVSLIVHVNPEFVYKRPAHKDREEKG